MRFLIITDPRTHSELDVTFELYRVLPEDPRFELCHLHPAHLGDASALPVVPVPSPLGFPEFLALDEAPVVTARLTDFDLAMQRTDKPYPDGFIDWLVRHEDLIRFVTRPSGIRDCSDRVFTRSIADRFMPPGLVTRDVAEAAAFMEAQGRVVAKRNQSYGGKGVVRLSRAGTGWVIEPPDGEPLEFGRVEALLEHLFAADPDRYEFVRYLESVRAGDKRVLVVEGEVYGGYLRTAAEGRWISNLMAGGHLRPATVTRAEAAMIAATWRPYHDRGLDLLGYDFLVDQTGEPTLSEINSANVGGYGLLERTTGMPFYPRLLDWIAGRKGP